MIWKAFFFLKLLFDWKFIHLYYKIFVIPRVQSLCHHLFILAKVQLFNQILKQTQFNSLCLIVVNEDKKKQFQQSFCWKHFMHNKSLDKLNIRWQVSLVNFNHEICVSILIFWKASLEKKSSNQYYRFLSREKLHARNLIRFKTP